jgi:hypothetical protein
LDIHKKIHHGFLSIRFMQALYTLHLTAEHRNNTHINTLPPLHLQGLKGLTSSRIIWMVWSNRRTKQIQTTEIHGTSDGHIYVVRRSTRVQQFLHWKDIFTLVLGLIPVTADTHQNSGVNKCRVLNGIIKRLFHYNLVHANHLHQGNRRPEITHTIHMCSACLIFPALGLDI